MGFFPALLGAFAPGPIQGHHASKERLPGKPDWLRVRFGDYGPGFYVAEEPAAARIFGSTLHRVRITLRRPLIVTPETSIADVRRLYEGLEMGAVRPFDELVVVAGTNPATLVPWILKQAKHLFKTPDELRRRLLALGYDGAIVSREAINKIRPLSLFGDDEEDPRKRMGDYAVAYDPDAVEVIEAE